MFKGCKNRALYSKLTLTIFSLPLRVEFVFRYIIVEYGRGRLCPQKEFLLKFAFLSQSDHKNLSLFKKLIAQRSSFENCLSSYSFFRIFQRYLFCKIFTRSSNINISFWSQLELALLTLYCICK